MSDDRAVLPAIRRLRRAEFAQHRPLGINRRVGFENARRHPLTTAIRAREGVIARRQVRISEG